MYNEDLDNIELACEVPAEVHQLPYGYSSGVLYFQFEKKPLIYENSTKDRLASLFPVITTLLIVLFQARAYVFWYILPSLEKNNKLALWEGLFSNRHLLQFYVFVILSFIFMLSTVFTVFTKPGEVVDELSLEAENLRNNVYQVSISEGFLDRMHKLGNSERKKTLFPRFCRSCLKVKPDRSHHCSVCNKCVLKMDHHCPYVNNCIGNMNYKYFMNMILSAAGCSGLISATMWEGVNDVWENDECELRFQVAIGVSYFGGLMLTVVLVAFCCFHFYLIANGLTTIEFREKMTVKFDSSPYDRGCGANFVEVFGSNPLGWMVPVSN